MITRDDLERMFDAVRRDAPFSIDEICLWGYFFVDRDRTRLSTARGVLEGLGYRFVGIFEPSPDDEDAELLFLHVEREERHSIESLERRNAELYALADELGLESYDGMDVGPRRLS